VSLWSPLIALSVSTAALVFMRRRRISKWFVASLPWWVVSNSSGWFELIAALLTLGGFIALAVGPTLPGRRRGRSKAEPLPHLANGPVVAVESRIYPGARPSRVLSIITIIMFCLTVVLAVATGMGAPAEVAALALSALVIATTLAFSNWFSGRLRLRIDQHGLHSRVFFAEQTIGWPEVAGITLRYVFFPGMGVRLVYYVVYSATHEYAFPSSMANAKELQAQVEAATGLAFPEPDITPNM